MVDVNPNASALQLQLQAQLQAKQSDLRARGNSAEIKPRDVIDERIKAKSDDRGGNRQLPVRQSDRSLQLSSSKELEAAKARVSQVAGSNRESPTGRTSLRENEARNQPLGQIIDIRV